MGKNIVICCDGTGNEFGPTNSNVVKLFQVLAREGPAQATYYDPGVGTMAAPQAISEFMKKATWICGLAFGYGLKQKVCEAYTYLMEYYEPGDHVFIFGFSRGAYTARALAAMLHKCGLLEKGADNQVPYAYQIFQNHANFAIAAGYKKTFSRPCLPHFVGVWDTVSTIGWIYNPIALDYTAHNPDIQAFRHAVSIDERRTHFRTNLFFPADGQDCKQVWFAGVHSDVGGGYPEPESGLAKITLQWMVNEAVAHGLSVDQEMFKTVVLGEGDPGYCKPDAAACLHNSLEGAWKIVEHFPRRYIDLRSGKPVVTWRWSPISGFYAPRFMPDGSHIHASVAKRMGLVADYKPVNLAANTVTEPWT
jgi:uncharacterized protein (DUF2235 family)